MPNVYGILFFRATLFSLGLPTPQAGRAQKEQREVSSSKGETGVMEEGHKHLSLQKWHRHDLNLRKS